MNGWYVVQTLARSEERANVNLQRQGFRSYLPRLRRERRHARRRELVQAPVFPGYLFVQLDLGQQQWRSINGTYGVSRLLCHGNRPAPVAGAVVADLMEREDTDGFVALPPPSFDKGDRLRFVSGAMKDCFGLFEGMAARERVVVLLDLLGRQVRVEAPIEAVAATG